VSYFKKVNVFICLILFMATSAFAVEVYSDTCKALVIFVKFKGDTFDNDCTIEWPGERDSLPIWANDIIDSNEVSIRERTITHFYNEMSFGKLKFYGKIYKSLYITDSVQTFYSRLKYPSTAADSLEKKILRDLDSQINYADFDYNGDGYLDYVFFIYRTWLPVFTPFSYLISGWYPLGFSITLDGITIDEGTQQYSCNKNEAINIAQHEAGHSQRPSQIQHLYPYGIGGYCGVMGFKWNDIGSFAPLDSTGKFASRSNPLCTKYVNQNGWMDDSLFTINGSLKNREIRHRGSLSCGKGQIFKLPVNGSSSEYFLVENRQNKGYYDHYNPGKGLLIYHINGDPYVECADGLWNDHGWDNDDPPETANTVSGKNNIGFWSDTPDTCAKYYGNLGDTTDWFDGVTYKYFTEASNPSSKGYSGSNQNVASHVAVLNIRKKTGADSIMIADFYTNNWTGHISSNTIWSDSVHISGDIIVDVGCTLTINPGCLVEIEPDFDDQDTGVSSTKTEFYILGMLKAEGTIADSITFTSSAVNDTAGDWWGIYNKGKISLKYCKVEYPIYGVYAESGNDTTKVVNCLIQKYQTYGVKTGTNYTSGNLVVTNTLIQDGLYDASNIGAFLSQCPL
jgi:M6 family metalloprotease-like protein